MTYKIRLAEIVLHCDGCGVARPQFSQRSVSACIWEARESGWRVSNTEKARTNLIADMKKLTCLCQDCETKKCQRG